MNIQHPTAEKANCCVVVLGTHVLGGSEALQFSTVVQEQVAGGITKLIVNLSAVEVMNSSGLGMLVAANSVMRKHNGSMVLAEIPEGVKKLLDMTRLASIISMAPTVEEALL